MRERFAGGNRQPLPDRAIRQRHWLVRRHSLKNVVDDHVLNRAFAPQVVRSQRGIGERSPIRVDPELHGDADLNRIAGAVKIEVWMKPEAEGQPVFRVQIRYFDSDLEPPIAERYCQRQPVFDWEFREKRISRLERVRERR